MTRPPARTSRLGFTPNQENDMKQYIRIGEVDLSPLILAVDDNGFRLARHLKKMCKTCLPESYRETSRLMSELRTAETRLSTARRNNESSELLGG